MTQPEILVLARIHPPTLTALERDFIVHRLWLAPEPDSFLRKIAPNVRAVVTNSSVGCDRSQIEALPKLEIIACFGTGHSTLDLAAAKAHGVTVTNTPDSTAQSVADLAMGLILSVMRRIGENDRFVRAGQWLSAAPRLGRELGGKTCGIIGLGRIGSGIARRAEACGMSVCYHGRREKPEVPYPYYAELRSMAAASDCLVVACPATPQTIGIVDATVLTALGADGFLVNVARGAIVEEQALIAALTRREIAGAGLDVFWDEPNVPLELRELEQVVIVPHIGTSTQEMREARNRNLLANLEAHFSGKPVLTPLT